VCQLLPFAAAKRCHSSTSTHPTQTKRRRRSAHRRGQPVPLPPPPLQQSPPPPPPPPPRPPPAASGGLSPLSAAAAATARRRGRRRAAPPARPSGRTLGRVSGGAPHRPPLRPGRLLPTATAALRRLLGPTTQSTGQLRRWPSYLRPTHRGGGAKPRSASRGKALREGSRTSSSAVRGGEDSAPATAVTAHDVISRIELLSQLEVVACTKGHPTTVLHS